MSDLYNPVTRVWGTNPYSLDAFPDPTEAEAWTGDDARPDDARAAALHAEEIRERDWHELESHARDFIRAYGVPAMLRCVSESAK